MPSVPSAKSRAAGFFFIFVSAAAFGFAGIFVKLAYSQGVGTTTLLAWRYVLAAALLWALLAATGGVRRLPGRTLAALLALGGLGYGAMSTLFWLSIGLTSASVASVLLYTYPVIVSVLSAVFFRERFGAAKKLALVLSSCGLVLVVGVSAGALNPVGIACGLGSAVFYSIYIVLSSRLLKGVPPLAVTAWVSSGAALVFLAYGLARGLLAGDLGAHLLFAPTATACLSVAGLVVVSTIIAFFTFFRGMAVLGPSTASIASSIEPVVTVCAAYLIFAERLGPLQLLGGILVVAAVVLAELKGKA